MSSQSSIADGDPTGADGDQTRADTDQTSADSDQTAADSDQAASDRDLVAGGDPEVHDHTRDLRDRSAQRRQQGADARVAAAGARDAAANARDREALARDRAAELRDRALIERDGLRSEQARAITGAEIVLRAAESRRLAAADRAAAAEARARAAADRADAARDREQAARDRIRAQTDRDALLHQLAQAETDQLTGARTRAAGLADLDRELERASRTAGELAIAFVDVVGLKAVNDARGHLAGDALLRGTAQTIREQLRPYDLIVRLGGDEFVCVMPGATVHAARRRFDVIQSALAAASDPCAIKVGFAALAPGDSAAEIIKRADAELPKGSRR